MEKKTFLVTVTESCTVEIEIEAEDDVEASDTVSFGPLADILKENPYRYLISNFSVDDVKEKS
jgi:hypothetical protein